MNLQYNCTQELHFCWNMVQGQDAQPRLAKQDSSLGKKLKDIDCHVSLRHTVDT